MSAVDHFVEINGRLENWGRWVHVSQPPGHCASIEHRYVPPRPGDGVEERANWKQSDALDALIVEDAVFMLRDPRDKQFLIAVYVRRVRMKNLCKRYSSSKEEIESRRLGVMDELHPHIEHVEKVRSLNPGHIIVREFAQYRRQYASVQTALGPIEKTHPLGRPALDVRKSLP